MRIFLILIALAGCSDGTHRSVDAAVGAPVTLGCETYCTEIQANCTGANAQYPDTAHCFATCMSFTVGTGQTTDMSGNTLECRTFHAGTPSITTPATHCVYAGPGGDLI